MYKTDSWAKAQHPIQTPVFSSGPYGRPRQFGSGAGVPKAITTLCAFGGTPKVWVLEVRQYELSMLAQIRLLRLGARRLRDSDFGASHVLFNHYTWSVQ